MKRIAILILLLVLAAAAAGTAVVLDLLAYAATPAKKTAEAEVFAVSPGEPFSALAGRLFDRGLIEMPQKFRRYARLRGFDKQVKAGEYELSAAMAPRQILSTMVEGKVRLRRLTIPEGYNLVQIAAASAAAGLASEEEFLSKAYDQALVRKMGFEAESFEGYLFPETYYFPRNLSAKQMISAMVERFRAVFLPPWQRRAEQIGFSVHEIVTLASIIEKETGAAEERPLIASVFHNRLAKGMRLESDPTVIYGIESFDGNLTRKHLRTPTAYNTYRMRGLPPGPIASPGRASIEAALFPAESPYLYFVSKKDGTHHFSTTYREHNAAVRKYQLGR